MTNTYWLKLLASFIVIIVVPVCWIAFEQRDNGAEAVEAANGVIDLRELNMASIGKIRLNGEWMLYPRQLQANADLAGNPAAPQRQPIAVSVPGVWNYLPELSRGLGTATYRLRLLLPEGTSGIYGIRTTNIRTSSRVYVNGTAVGESGSPGMSREDTIPGNAPYVGYFRLDGPEAEIVVQVANYSYVSGGIVYPIWFGTQESIARSRELNLFEYWLTASGFLIPALFLLLFFRLRRREAPLLQLGGFCVCSLVYVLTHGEKAAVALLPAVGYEWVLRVQMISSGFVYYFLARYVVQLYPRFGVRPFDWLVTAYASAVGLAGLVLPTYLVSRGELLLLVFSLLSIGYVLYVLTRAVWARREHTLALAVSFQSVLIILAVYLLRGYSGLENQSILPYAVIVFCASQAYLIVSRFSDLLGYAERMSERLLLLDERKDEFMLNTSYEIREPLQGIVNLAAAREQGRDGGRGEEQRLATIAGIARRLSYLVDDMIDFSLLKSGEAEYRRRAIHLQPVVRSVLELYPSRTSSVWTLEPMPPGLPPVLADERRLGQIVHNLIAYAIRHARGNDVRLAAQAGAGRVTLVIAASGMGAALTVERDAPEFYPADEAAAESAERLRMSVTRQLIERGGGEWRAAGAADGEETLYVSWPAVSSEAAGGKIASEPPEAPVERASAGRARNGRMTEAEEAHTQSRGPSVRRPRSAEFDDAGDRHDEGSILIVEDDMLGAQVMTHLLGGDGVSIRIAASGAEALESLKEARVFDLVIVDLVMPDMSGLELVRRIREHANLSELPIMLLSEGRRPEEVLAGFRAGANDMLVKPYEASELKARVGTLLQLRSSVRSLVRTETAFLQAQIKPHFLFNALNTIMSVCLLDPPQAEKLLLELSRYLRASFDFGNLAQSVPLRGELELVRSYLAIESARFDDRLRAEFAIECDDLILVPPLSIQPLVENAVRHGIMRKPQGGTVRVRIVSEALGWRVTVEDDGIGMPPGRLHEHGAARGVGLANISRRLRLMYGEDLHIESRSGEGTRVGFLIPGGMEHESDID